jgi:hypothetical protein
LRQGGRGLELCGAVFWKESRPPAPCCSPRAPHTPPCPGVHPSPPTPTGVRLVVEVRRGYEARVVLNQLLKHTRLQVGCVCGGGWLGGRGLEGRGVSVRGLGVGA